MFLDVEEAQIISRLTKRGRDDDDPQVVLNRLRKYVNSTQPLISFYEKEELINKINGNGTEKDVFNKLLEVVS